MSNNSTDPKESEYMYVLFEEIILTISNRCFSIFCFAPGFSSLCRFFPFNGESRSPTNFFTFVLLYSVVPSFPSGITGTFSLPHHQISLLIFLNVSTTALFP